MTINKELLVKFIDEVVRLEKKEQFSNSPTDRKKKILDIYKKISLRDKNAN